LCVGVFYGSPCTAQSCKSQLFADFYSVALAYTVVRSTSQSYGDSKISGGQNSHTHEQIAKKLAWVITSAMTPRMPKFKTIDTLGAWRRMREISSSRMVFSARCNYTSHTYAMMSVSVCLSICM